MSKLPETINLRSAVLYMRSDYANYSEMSDDIGVPVASLFDYSAGRRVRAPVVNCLRILQASEKLPRFHLQQIIGMDAVPALPECIDWPGITKAIKATYLPGEMSRHLTQSQQSAFHTARAYYAKGTRAPFWKNAAIMLNLAQERLTQEQYHQFTHRASEAA